MFCINVELSGDKRHEEVHSSKQRSSEGYKAQPSGNNDRPNTVSADAGCFGSNSLFCPTQMDRSRPPAPLPAPVRLDAGPNKFTFFPNTGRTTGTSSTTSTQTFLARPQLNVCHHTAVTNSTWHLHPPVEPPSYAARLSPTVDKLRGSKQSERGRELTIQRLTRRESGPIRNPNCPKRQMDPDDVFDASPFSETHVFLNIYNVKIAVGPVPIDFSVLNSFFENWIGAYHVGIELFETEWQYGWCQEGSGICHTDPRGNTEHTYLKTVDLGPMGHSVTADDFDKILRNIADDWLGEEYNIATKNCIHFAQRITEIIGTRQVPQWLFRLSHILPSGLNLAASGSCAAPSRASNISQVGHRSTPRS